MLRPWSLGVNVSFWETVQHVTVSLNCLLLFHSKTVPVTFCFVLSALVRVPVAGPWPRGVVSACVPPAVLAERSKGPPHCALFTVFAFIASHHLRPGSQRPSGRSWSRSQGVCHQGQGFHDRARETCRQLPRFLLNSPAPCRHAPQLRCTPSRLLCVRHWGRTAVQAPALSPGAQVQRT